MDEQFIEFYIGVHPADAEQVRISYLNGDLHLAYIDWQEQSRQAQFTDTLAFRWQEYDDAKTPRDDTSYRVANSKWLSSQLADQAHYAEYAHYKICFNACGVLDVLCKAIEVPSLPSLTGGSTRTPT